MKPVRYFPTADIDRFGIEPGPLPAALLAPTDLSFDGVVRPISRRFPSVHSYPVQFQEIDMTLRTSSARSATPRLVRLAALSAVLALAACGGSAGDSGGGIGPQPEPPAPAPSPSPAPPPVVSKGSVSLLAGSLGGPGNLDGTGASARFSGPGGLALDGAGDLYVADQGNQRIRKVTRAGVVTTFAGSGQPGHVDGAAAQATFCYPQDVAVDPAGNVFVAETQTVRKITPDRQVQTVAGSATAGCDLSAFGNAAPRSPQAVAAAGVVSTVAGSGQLAFADGPAMQASFCAPDKIAVSPDASVFVVDNNRVRKIDAARNVKTVTGSTTGYCDYAFNGSVAPRAPRSIAVDAFGVVYIGDSLAGAIYRLTPAGELAVFADKPDGARPDLAFSASRGLALDAARNVYAIGGFVPDLRTNSVVRISQTGEITTVVPASPAINATADLARDAAGNLYVIDGSASRVVRKITPDGGISIIAGTTDTSYQGGNVDGPLGTGRLSELRGIAAAADGTVYVSESSNTIRRIDPVTGNVSTLAGRVPRSSYFGPLAADRAGNVFFVDYKPYPQEAGIGRIAPDGTVSTLVGGGLKQPSDLALDAAGNLYVLDSNGISISTQERGAAFVVRKITPQGEMSVFAGSLNDAAAVASVDVDGVGTAARLNNARALTTDPAGNVYVAQYLGAPLRKITPQGVVSTVAVALPGTMQFPNAVAADEAGNTYLVSCARAGRGYPNPANAAILKVDPNQHVSVLAGSLTETGYVDGLGAQARFAAVRGLYNGITFSAGTCPSALALDAADNLFVADTDNDTVRKITPDGVVSTAVGQQGVRGVAPGPLPTSLARPYGLSFDAVGHLYIGAEGSVLKVQLPQ